MAETAVAGTLFVVGTPIGNMGDITLRALETLTRAAVIAAEDTRVTAKLLARHEISTPLTSFREQNTARALPKLIAILHGGDDVALVTDAGTPGVSDPGYALVSAAASADIRVVPIPGPSAAIAAVSVAGLTGDDVRFVGFLPRAGRRRRDKIQALATDPSLSVIYEAPGRLKKTLGDLADACGAERRAGVFREMTKLHEEHARGTLDELVEHFSGKTKGELTIVLEGNKTAGEATCDDATLHQLIVNEIAKGRSVKQLAASLSSALGLPRKKIYDMAVSIVSSE
jgi:16S rRNA (cytidine1402-2'-O)-methyltransferase